MKTIVLSSLVGLSILVSQNALAASSNVLDLSGHYQCTGYDIHDKAFSDALVITLNPQNSRLALGYGAYDYESTVNGKVVYKGSIASNGNNFAMTFDNPQKPTDYGTITGVATYDLNSQGVPETVLHSFYYQPAYMGGSNGTATCVKQ